MVKRALLLLALSCSVPAHAGLLSDDEARQQVKDVGARVSKLENTIEQQVRSMLDLNSQIETLNAELRKLRGQNEELARGLQDAEKREKDFYVDLDTRLRHFETAEQEAAAKPAAATAPAADAADPDDPVAENRAYEAAYALFKAGNHLDAIGKFQEFAKKYPRSVHLSNALYWQGNAQSAMSNYKAALETFVRLHKDHPGYARDADVLLSMAACQRELKKKGDEKKTLKLLISIHPDSEAAVEAKKLLGSSGDTDTSKKKK